MTCVSILLALLADAMPPITRRGSRRGGRGGNANDQPQVQPQVQVTPTQDEAVAVPAIQQNVQAVVVPQPVLPIYAPSNVDKFGE